jgi:hypothetical protein
MEVAIDLVARPKTVKARLIVNIPMCNFFSYLWQNSSSDTVVLIFKAVYRQRTNIYIGVEPEVKLLMNPSVRQVKSLPIAKIPTGADVGTDNGPQKRAKDCKMSDTLRPKMMRR